MLIFLSGKNRPLSLAKGEVSTLSFQIITIFIIFSHMKYIWMCQSLSSPTMSSVSMESLVPLTLDSNL